MAIGVAGWAPPSRRSRPAGRLLDVSMMAVAATSPMNGVRIGRTIALTDIFLVVGLGALFAGSVTARRHSPAVPRPLLTGCVMVALGGCVGALFSPRPLAGFPHLLLFTLGGVPVLVVFRWAPDVGTLRRYTWSWLAGAVASGICGLIAPGDAAGRTAGLTTHPNHFAMVSALGAGLALALTLGETGRRRLLAAASLTVLLLAVLRAGSRAGLVALLVTAAIVIARTRRPPPRTRRLSRVALTVLALAIAAMALGTTHLVDLGRHNAIERSVGDATSSASDRERYPVLEAGVRRIVAHPITGSGFESVLQAHNIYVGLWAAAGLLGLCGFLLIARTTVQAALLQPRDSPARLLADAYAAGYIGYLVAGCAQNFLWDRYLWLHAAVIIWLGSNASHRVLRRTCDLTRGVDHAGECPGEDHPPGAGGYPCRHRESDGEAYFVGENGASDRQQDRRGKREQPGPQGDTRRADRPEAGGRPDRQPSRSHRQAKG